MYDLKNCNIDSKNFSWLRQGEVNDRQGYSMIGDVTQIKVV